ncbi:MAG: short-chain dehydrogenase protein [Nevskia sp.]|nr:short-chain dehydrogenase protein [Nevskia sp.]
MNAQQGKVFFITGVSTGFGRAFAIAALAAGHRVAGTLRNESARMDFEQLGPGRAFGKLADVTDAEAVTRAVAEVEAQVGPIDVLINNAGYGHEGLIEESPLSDLRQQFEVNVFGAVSVIKAVLPYMRQRRRGHIINITSMGGLITFPGLAYYHGSKFALEGISETLAKEVKGFGIAVTAVEPGGFRTDWAGRSMVRVPRSIADYDAMFAPMRAAREQRSGKQNGDPAKAAQAILQLIEAKEPPLHLPLGEDAVQGIRDKIALLQRELDAWEQVSLSTGFN